MRLWPRRKVYVDDLPKTHDLRFATTLVALFVCVLGALYLAGYVVVGDRVPSGTTVEGVDIGGMRASEAEAALTEALAPRLLRHMQVAVGSKTFDLTPQQAGLTFDIDATVDNALGGSGWNPHHMLRVAIGGGDVAPVVDVDVPDLESTLKRLSKDVLRPAVDAQVTFSSGTPEVVAAREGESLNIVSSARRLKDALLADDDKVTLPLSAADPDVSTRQAMTFLAHVARPATTGSVSIKIADTTVVVHPKTFVTALRTVPDGGTLRLGVDAAHLDATSKAILAGLPHQPANAAVGFRHGHPYVIASRSGVTVSAHDWADAVLRAVQSNRRTAVAHVEELKPAVSTGDLTALGMTQLVSSASVPLATPSGDAETRAVRRLNGTIVKPHTTFGLLTTIGSGLDSSVATAVASAIYQAALSAGMADIARTASTTRPVGIPAGLDAFVAYPYPDLGWSNPTAYGIYIRAYVTGAGSQAEIHVGFWSTHSWAVTLTTSARRDIVNPTVEHQSGTACQAHPGSPGFTVDVTRTISRHGAQPRTDVTTSTYQPLPVVVCR